MATDVTNFGSLDVVDHDGATYGLKLAGTLVTDTAAELNIMDTVTVTAAELNYLDIATLGTGAASKAEQEQAGAMPVQQFAEMVGGAGANAAIAPVNGAGSA